MTNQSTLTQNIRQVILGVPPHHKPTAYKPAPTAKKKQLAISLPVILVTAVLTVIITSLWLNLQVFTNQPKAQAGFSEPENVAVVEPIPSSPPPVRLKIDSINVDAAIEAVGLTGEGAMDIPDKTENVGWFNIGPHPGEIGSAVMTGHFDSEDSAIGVFHELHLLKAGDEVTVLDDSGIWRTFVVTESRMYDWDDDVPEVFYNTDGTYLNLITCSGSWSDTEEKFDQRLVVFTTLKP